MPNYNKSKNGLISVLAILGLFIAPVFAQESNEDDSAQHLLGNWGGSRSYLAEQGISVDAILTNTYLGNVRGGEDKGTALIGNFDLTAEVDTAKAELWDGGTFFFYGLGNYGDEITKSVGNIGVVDNTETYSTAKLYEAWYQHQLFDDSLSLLVGLHDYNSEFDALEYAGTLINSSFGISTDIASIGPSIFSNTSAAFRVKAFCF